MGWNPLKKISKAINKIVGAVTGSGAAKKQMQEAQRQAAIQAQQAQAAATVAEEQARSQREALIQREQASREAEASERLANKDVEISDNTDEPLRRRRARFNRDVNPAISTGLHI